MENKNLIRTFCGCKPSKKKNKIEPHQNFSGSYKKCEGSGLTPKYTESKKVSKLWQKLSEQQDIKFLNQVYLREKEAYNNK